MSERVSVVGINSYSVRSLLDFSLLDFSTILHRSCPIIFRIQMFSLSRRDGVSLCFTSPRETNASQVQVKIKGKYSVATPQCVDTIIQ